MLSVKQYILNMLGKAWIRKKLIQFSMRGIIIRRDFYVTLKYKFPAKNPKGLNEKINWVKLYRKDYRMPILTDKELVRGWVSDTIGKEYLIPLLGVYETIEELKKALPNLEGSFVLKSTCGGGGNEVILCEDKTQINWVKIEEQIKTWLNSKVYWKTGEWQYKKLVPKIICERMIAAEATDYKIFCFDGKACFLTVDFNRFSGHKQQFFDFEWNRIPMYYMVPQGEGNCVRPDNLEEMRKLAEKLSADFDFVRVDLYNENGHIYYGEMTFTPGNGTTKFKPEKFEEKFGELWKLDTKKRMISGF